MSRVDSIDMSKEPTLDIHKCQNFSVYLENVENIL